MRDHAVQRPSLWPWLSLLLCGVAYDLFQFSSIFFRDEPLRFVRLMLAPIVCWKVGKAVLAVEWRGFHARGWLIFVPAALVLHLVQPFLHGSSLALYAFLLEVLGLVYLIGGPAVVRRTSALLGGMALLVYPPQIVFAPALVWLHAFELRVLPALAGVLLPDVRFIGSLIVVAGRDVQFADGCSGSDFLMTYVAVTVIFLAGKASARRLCREVVFAIALGLLLNFSRVLIMLALTEAGQADLALGSGHLLLGQGFILIGLLVILLRADDGPASAAAPLVRVTGSHCSPRPPQSSLG